MSQPTHRHPPSRAHERVCLAQRDHLDSHTDHPSGNAGFERQRAFVWHLSAREWEAGNGGEFVDEATGDKYAPMYNHLVHFGVPRPHRVDAVASHVTDARYSVYGWVITAKVWLSVRPHL